MSDRIRVLIVDDEPLARRGVRLHLEAAGGFDVIGESANGREAIADIQRLAPQAVFLDVQMPGVDGFAVIDAVGIEQMPVTIFVTAYDRHALQAFDAHAVDYLLKPIDPARFARAAERVRTLVSRGTLPRRIVLRDGARVLLVDHDEIDWIEADGDYVRVYVGGRGHLVRHTIGGMERRLEPSRFARVHRSAIVNVARVRAIGRQGDRSFQITLRDGTAIAMSRGYRDRLAQLVSDRDSSRGHPGTVRATGSDSRKGSRESCNPVNPVKSFRQDAQDLQD
ncbi:MAG: LytTR family DNA-binding domain-containing protein [Gemmatimonadaceae bacterium]